MKSKAWFESSDVTTPLDAKSGERHHSWHEKDRRSLSKFTTSCKRFANSRNTEKPRRRGLCCSSTINSQFPLSHQSLSTTTNFAPATTAHDLSQLAPKLTSKTKVLFPTRNISKWSQIVNGGGTFAHSISSLLEKTKNKLQLKELSPSGQIQFVNMMNRDLTLMQTIELYTALTPHKFTLAYRLKFNVQSNGVYINFSMSQPNQTNTTTPTTSPILSQQQSLSNSQPATSTNNSSSISPTSPSNTPAQPTSTTRNGWALFQISRENSNQVNSSILPNKIIEVAILM